MRVFSLLIALLFLFLLSFELSSTINLLRVFIYALGLVVAGYLAFQEELEKMKLKPRTVKKE